MSSEKSIKSSQEACQCASGIRGPAGETKPEMIMGTNLPARFCVGRGNVYG